MTDVGVKPWPARRFDVPQSMQLQGAHQLQLAVVIDFNHVQGKVAYKICVIRQRKGKMSRIIIKGMW